MFETKLTTSEGVASRPIRFQTPTLLSKPDLEAEQLKRAYQIVPAIVGVFVVLWATGALATDPTPPASTDVFDAVITKLLDLASQLRNTVYVAAALAIAACAIGGILGKLKWQTLAHIAGALFLLALAAEIVNYATGSSGVGNTINMDPNDNNPGSQCTDEQMSNGMCVSAGLEFD